MITKSELSLSIQVYRPALKYSLQFCLQPSAREQEPTISNKLPYVSHIIKTNKLRDQTVIICLRTTSDSNSQNKINTKKAKVNITVTKDFMIGHLSVIVIVPELWAGDLSPGMKIFFQKMSKKYL
jgi:hypothetical protein